MCDVETLTADAVARAERRMKDTSFCSGRMLGENESFNEVVRDDSKYDAKRIATYLKDVVKVGIDKQAADLDQKPCPEETKYYSSMTAMMLSMFGGQSQTQARPRGANPMFPLWDGTDFFAKLPAINRQWCAQRILETKFDYNGQRFLFCVVAWGGAQECPFKREDDSKYYGYQCGSLDYYIKNLSNDQDLVFSDLALHMMEKHDFFEGHGTKYRVDPEQVVKVFNDLNVHRENDRMKA